MTVTELPAVRAAQASSSRELKQSLIDKGVAREGVSITDAEGNEIGKLTSGGHSPSLNKSIAMGYILAEYSAADTDVFLDVRGRKLKAVVTKLPFIEAKTKSATPKGKAA